jgi:hypothetical protein
MRQTELRKRIDTAGQRVLEEIKANGQSGGFFARGLASEGYAGGYLQALYDIALLLNDVEPETRGYWRKP